MITANCADCGTEFSYQLTPKGYPRKKTLCNACNKFRGYKPCTNCSKRCRAAYNRQGGNGMCQTCWGRTQRRPGAKILSTEGYVKVIVWNGDVSRRVSEHRIIWEQAFGPLPDGWVVHHLNGIRDDNRLENLLGIATKAHDLIPDSLSPRARYIAELQARIRLIESKLGITSYQAQQSAPLRYRY